MGMFAFKLALLFCISSTICNLVESARILENNSSDLWRKLILTEDLEVPSPQSAPLSRRITPKSIFIVPDRDPCPQGQIQDSAGRCVRLVPVDSIANRNYLLMKLKHVFSMTSRPKEAAPESTLTTSKQPLNEVKPTQVAPKDSGPLQLSIPFQSKNISEDEPTQTFKTITSTSKTKKPAVGVTEAVVTEVDTESTSTDSVTITEATTLEATGSTLPAELVASEVTTELDTTTMVDTVRPELSLAEASSSPMLFGSELPGATFDPIRDETTTVRVYRRPGHDILKTGVRFPESNEKRNVIPTPFVKSGVDLTTSSSSRTSNPLPEASRPTLSVNFKGTTNTKDTSSDNKDFIHDSSAGLMQHSHNAGDNSDSSISGSSSFAFSNSENIGSSIISFKNDKDQKLPSTERIRPKCDPLTGYNCVEVKNVVSPEKGMYALSRSPFPPFIRFPGIVTNSHPLIRFPHGQKAPVNVDDVISLAEANNGYRHWESNRYTNPYWTPQLVRIWPENTLSNIEGVNNYGSRSQSVTFS